MVFCLPPSVLLNNNVKLLTYFKLSNKLSILNLLTIEFGSIIEEKIVIVINQTISSEFHAD